MLSLRRLNLDNLGGPDEVQSAAQIMYESNNIILEYNSLESFKKNFNKFFLVLEDFKDKISAVNSLTTGSIFEGDVYVMSTLEDKLGIPINSLFISSAFENPIHDLTEFYFDDINDGSFELNILSSPNKNPLHIIEWILLSNLNGGTNLTIDMDTINPVWLNEREIFDSIYPYINSFSYKNYIQVVK